MRLLWRAPFRPPFLCCISIAGMNILPSQRTNSFYTSETPASRFIESRHYISHSRGISRSSAISRVSLFLQLFDFAPTLRRPPSQLHITRTGRYTSRKVLGGQSIRSFKLELSNHLSVAGRVRLWKPFSLGQQATQEAKAGPSPLLRL